MTNRPPRLNPDRLVFVQGADGRWSALTSGGRLMGGPARTATDAYEQAKPKLPPPMPEGSR